MSDQPRREAPDLSDPRLAVPTRSKPSPLDLPPWLTSTVAVLFGMAMVGSGTGLAVPGRKRGEPRPVARRRNISRRRAWLEAIALWGSVATVIAGARLWEGSWLAATKAEGLVLVGLAGLFTIFAIPVLVIRLVRSTRRSKHR